LEHDDATSELMKMKCLQKTARRKNTNRTTTTKMRIRRKKSCRIRHTRENAKLLKTVKEYDAYIKQLIYMVDTLGARLKQFGLEHYF
jgi:hypothetical protein